eukprot:9503978-Pyramimonas_sp.AAC.1
MVSNDPGERERAMSNTRTHDAIFYHCDEMLDLADTAEADRGATAADLSIECDHVLAYVEGAHKSYCMSCELRGARPILRESPTKGAWEATPTTA